MNELELAHATTAEQAVAAINEKYTAKQWVTMPTTEKQNFKIRGLTLYNLAKKFGRDDLCDAHSSHISHYRLGIIIFGEENEAVKAAVLREEEVLNALSMPIEDFIRAIKEVVLTSTQWLAMDQKAKSAFKFRGLGLKIIATKFGFPITFLPVNRQIDHCLLGAKIYGEDDSVIKKYLEENKDKIR